MAIWVEGAAWRWRRLFAAVGLAALCVGVLSAGPVAAQVDDDDEIVYLDPNGVIRVIDPRPPSDALKVSWFSPSGGWVDFALADVNGDGDSEIIAVRPESEGGRLVIFDPVAVGADEEDVEFIDGVPWATIFELPLETAPRLVTTGEFDLTRSGPEIIFDQFVPEEERTIPDDSRRFTILRQPEGERRGEAWETQTTFSTGNDWTWIDAGNLDGSGIDEIVLVDSARGNLSVYRVGDTFTRLYRNSSVENEWRVARFGQFTAGGGEELGAVRTADYPLASAWVFRWQGSGLADQFWETLIPSPRYMFWADISGNGDVEMVMLRPVPQELGQRPRLFIRDNGNDTIRLNDLVLDVDNGYMAGDGGDIDGDGRDEIVIMRNNRIRVYTEPELSTASIEFEVETDSRHIFLGNLDAAGLARSPQLGATESRITATLRVGEKGETVEVEVSDVTQGTSIPFNIDIEGAEEWASAEASRTSTPATLSVTLDATSLQPGDYQGAIVLRPTASGSEIAPWTIQLRLQVESGISTTPAVLFVEVAPCEEPFNVRTVPVSVEGPEGVAYTTAIEGGPDWVTVAPRSGTLPENITLTVDPAERPQDIATATLILTLDLPNAPGTQEQREIILACASDRKFMPVMRTPD